MSADDLHKNFIQNHVSDELRTNIELGHYNAAPSFFLFSTHSTMIIGFYLREGLGEFSPQIELEIKKGGVHAPFHEHYEALWQARVEATEDSRGTRRVSTTVAPQGAAANDPRRGRVGTAYRLAFKFGASHGLRRRCGSQLSARSVSGSIETPSRRD
ncbi:MAG: hypothetical protein ACQGVK_18285 [Myxococcota bacterium]